MTWKTQIASIIKSDALIKYQLYLSHSNFELWDPSAVLAILGKVILLLTTNQDYKSISLSPGQ